MVGHDCSPQFTIRLEKVHSPLITQNDWISRVFRGKGRGVRIILLSLGYQADQNFLFLEQNHHYEEVQIWIGPIYSPKWTGDCRLPDYSRTTQGTLQDSQFADGAGSRSQMCGKNGRFTHFPVGFLHFILTYCESGAKISVALTKC